MARLGLDKHRKFLRLARSLDATAPNMGELLARGALETLWDACYERADDWLGDDAEDIEIAARWRGESGALAHALMHCGGNGPGFVESDPDRGGYRVHDLWDHAPAWVRVKAERTAAREEAGKSIADVRREAGKKGRAKQLNRANGGQTSHHLPTTCGGDPGKRSAKNDNGTGRDGTGDPPISPASGGTDAAPLLLVPTDPHPKKPTRAERRATLMQEHRETASRVLDVFNAEREQLRLGGPLRATEGNLDEIVKRLRDGATLDECKHVIRAAAHEVNQGGEPRWFNPATLFRKTTWPVRLAAYVPAVARRYTDDEIAAAEAAEEAATPAKAARALALLTGGAL